MSWGRRLLHRPGLLYCPEQKLMLRLLADYPDEKGNQRLQNIVVGIGGVNEIFQRFLQHYVVRFMLAIS